MIKLQILEQMRCNGDDLAAIESQLERFENRLDGIGQRLGCVDGDLGAWSGRSTN